MPDTFADWGRVARRVALVDGARRVSVALWVGLTGRMAGVDEIVSLLTESDMEHLGVTAAQVQVSAGFSALTRYRFLGLPPGSPAGDAARALFDHGRGDAAFTEWCQVCEGWSPVSGGEMPRHVRDRRMLELRTGHGWTLEQIGQAFGMTKGGVSRALARMQGRNDDE